jgi:hypothetical protein
MSGSRGHVGLPRISSNLAPGVLSQIQPVPTGHQHPDASIARIAALRFILIRVTAEKKARKEACLSAELCVKEISRMIDATW